MRYIKDPRYRVGDGSTSGKRSTVNRRAINVRFIEYERATSNHDYGAYNVLSIETTIPVPVGDELLVNYFIYYSWPSSSPDQSPASD